MPELPRRKKFFSNADEIKPLLDAPVGMAFFRGDDGKFYADAGGSRGG